MVHENKPLNNVPVLDEKTFVPSGCTALLDAVGRTIDTVGRRLSNTPENARPSKVIMAILTDGEENSSREFTLDKVKEMIQHQQEKYAWEFIYLGANQDAFAEAAKIGIKSHDTVAFTATGVGVRSAYGDMNRLSAQYRTK